MAVWDNNFYQHLNWNFMLSFNYFYVVYGFLMYCIQNNFKKTINCRFKIKFYTSIYFKVDFFEFNKWNWNFLVIYFLDCWNLFHRVDLTRTTNFLCNVIFIDRVPELFLEINFIYNQLAMFWTWFLNAFLP